MYHGDPEHTGFVSDSDLNSANVASASFDNPAFTLATRRAGAFSARGRRRLHLRRSCQLPSRPEERQWRRACTRSTSRRGQSSNTFAWNLGNDTRDTHSFTGMGCTPLVTNDRVYFGAFNGKFYCLDQETLEPSSGLPTCATKTSPTTSPSPISNGVTRRPPAVIWTSPVISADGTKLYVGCGEGENPQLYSFVFCLDTGDRQRQLDLLHEQYFLHANEHNSAELSLSPQPGVQRTAAAAPQGFTIFDGEPIVMGCSVWGAIAYDKDLNRIYCSTGNQQPEPNDNWPGGGAASSPNCRAPAFPTASFRSMRTRASTKRSFRCRRRVIIASPMSTLTSAARR